MYIMLRIAIPVCGLLCVHGMIGLLHLRVSLQQLAGVVLMAVLPVLPPVPPILLPVLTNEDAAYVVVARLLSPSTHLT